MISGTPRARARLLSLLEFAVGQHVARGVRRPGDADRADVVRDVELVEIDMVLERVRVDVLDLRLARGEQIRAQAHVGVADILRNQRQENSLAGPVFEIPREEIEQDEEGRLAAVGHGDVPRPDAPAELPAQQACDCLDRTRDSPGADRNCRPSGRTGRPRASPPCSGATAAPRREYVRDCRRRA